ncbi:peptidase A2 domain-containing protein [Trichonephila inaurata madagascariensis]|uniref:Peptidase A2 domain-containing protein n=1 Tax=Trichonephila inaurata madagascariensis TaxID=2747483 RepID=A0A8X6MHY8_9ARAC|nr:peptidase A2 domain-containing protein [Trichonephila inaurata madagascariensis]
MLMKEFGARRQTYIVSRVRDRLCTHTSLNSKVDALLRLCPLQSNAGFLMFGAPVSQKKARQQRSWASSSIPAKISVHHSRILSFHASSSKISESPVYFRKKPASDPGRVGIHSCKNQRAKFKNFTFQASSSRKSVNRGLFLEKKAPAILGASSSIQAKISVHRSRISSFQASSSKISESPNQCGVICSLTTFDLLLQKWHFFSRRKGSDRTRRRVGLIVEAGLYKPKLKDLIVKSPDYVEDVKVMFDSIVKNCINTEEKAEKLRRQEREYELEKLRIQAERNTNTMNNSENVQAPKLIHETFHKFNMKDDISLNLTLFERHAELTFLLKRDWVQKLIGLIPIDIAPLIAREPADKCNDYDR